ncbi:GspH/FimT family pseudopilin [Microbulbifer sp. ALW1]|uniref:GspH/FimT family pseudopilin n=1 Tax=Microbulbifer sp. (strain ALW1) TaxID=1516059 RepID=UPI00272DF44D|nr:GspH/FimT family pseudopilin [Microbulbifer sp. ALW1]
MNNSVSQKGFTLVELMVVITVLGIIAAVGVPSFRSMIQDYRIVTKTDDINAVLQFARAEAVRSGGGVGVSAMGDDVANGLRVYVDANDNDSFDNGELVLRVFDIENASLAVSADVGGTDTANLQFTFNARGESNLADKLTLGVCDDRTGNHGRQLEMLVSGAVRLLTNTACSN